MFLIRWLRVARTTGGRTFLAAIRAARRLPAETIWSKVPEEAEPPRWRLDPTPEPAGWEVETRPSCVQPGDRVGILHA